jgi:hypothetical protein
MILERPNGVGNFRQRFSEPRRVRVLTENSRSNPDMAQTGS